MAELFFDDDADLSVVQSRNVAVLGYGSQGCAQALSLRDSGVDVRIGLPDGSAGRGRAQSAGLPVLTPYEACEEADLIVVLVPEAVQRTLYTDAIEPNLVDDDAVLFASGFSVRFGYITPPPGVDVILVAPKAPGELVRQEFEDGRGVPVLTAVEQDATGKAWDLTLSYARAIGGTRAGAIQTTFAEATEAQLFGGQAMLGGCLLTLVQAGYETLVEAGSQPEVALLECLHELTAVVAQLSRGDISSPWSQESVLAEYAALTAGPYVMNESVKQRMRNALTAIRDGSLAADFTTDQAAAAARPQKRRVAREPHPMEHTARELHSQLSWSGPNGTPSIEHHLAEEPRR